jgi:hypothetical protein
MIPEYDKECDCELCKRERKERAEKNRIRYIQFTDSMYKPPGAITGQQEYRITLEGNEKNRRQVEIEIHKNDYLTISFIGDINFASRWFGTADVMRDKLRSRPVHEQQASLKDSGFNEPGELEYGSILPNGEDWRLRRCDAGMGETEYRIKDALESVKELQAYPLNSHEIICLNIIKEALCSREQQFPVPTDEQCRKDATGEVLNRIFSAMNTFFGDIPMDANIIKWAVSKQDSFVTAAMASYLTYRELRKGG